MLLFLPAGRASHALPEESARMHTRAIRASRTAKPVCAASLSGERSKNSRISRKALYSYTHIISTRPDHIIPGAFTYFLLLQRRSRFIHRSLRRRRSA